MLDEVLLTMRQAARRVDRSLRTIRRWQRGGMSTRLVNGQRYVVENTLLDHYRERLNAWPPHQYRMRALLKEKGLDQ